MAIWMISGLTILLSYASPCLAPRQRVTNSEAVCKQHLTAIHARLIAFRKDHGKLPDQLSDLVPDYISDTALLHCPADPTPGDPDAENGHKDPKQPVSYSYEMNGDQSNGLSAPLGLFPKPDGPGTGWGTNRQVNLYQRTFFGDQVPMIRCFHHTKPSRDPDEDNVFNLTLNGRIYRSGWQWQNGVQTIGAALEQAELALKKGPKEFERIWRPGALEIYMIDWMRVPHVDLLRSRLRSFARLNLANASELHPAGEAHKMAAWLYFGAGDYPKTIAYARKALDIESASKRNAGRNQFLIVVMADSYIKTGQTAKTIPMYQAVLVQDRDNKFFMNRMADAYSLLGNTEKAKEWALKANPVHPLLGKTAPDFTLAGAAGEMLSLRDLMRGKKAVLVNFWFYH